jgi:uncharacterized repeat protein (TIGR01451 family)
VKKLSPALAVGAALGVASSADAATFNVTTNGDNGVGSLRQAIVDANTNAGPDTITFNAALSGSTITLSTGEMLISDSVDIQGLGSANLTVDANDTSRIFYVYNPSPVPVDVTISGLTLANGFSVVAGDPTASAGGAVKVVGENLALDDVDILNSVAGGAGGGLSFLGIDSTSAYNEVSAVLSVQNSTISGNTAQHIDLGVPIDQGGCGGGIYAASIYNVVLDNVALTNNTARCSGGGFAGIYFQDGGTVTIQSSVITGNNVDAVEGGYGGGVSLVYGYSYGTTASIADTTIAGNDGDSYGGGVAAVYLSGLDVTRSTISGNQASYGGGLSAVLSVATLENSTVAENAAGAYGGGIYGVYSNLTVKETTISGNTAGGDGPGIYAYGATEVDIVDSIVANNGSADLVDDSDSFFNVAYSLIENPDVAQINDGGGNILNDDPELGPLQDNGGPTFTMKPAGTSPVVNAGDPAFTPPPSTDQRGLARVVGGTIDMGAVELNAGTMQFSAAAQDVNENAGTANVTVTRTGGIDGAASVQVSVDGTSTATGGGDDYTFAGATINFADNDATPQVFNISIVDDGAVEPSETIVLTLGTAVGAAVGAPATHTVTILDNDVAPPPSANLSITKTLEPGPVTQGGDVTFTLAVTNAGPAAAANVVVTDTLPSQLAFVSATPSTGSCSGTVTITCNLGTLNPAISETITLVATMTGTGTTTNIAAVASDTADGDDADNTSQVTFTILPAEIAGVPALDPRMQVLLAALVAAAALGAMRRL